MISRGAPFGEWRVPAQVLRAQNGMDKRTPEQARPRHHRSCEHSPLRRNHDTNIRLNALFIAARDPQRVSAQVASERASCTLDLAVAEAVASGETAASAHWSAIRAELAELYTQAKLGAVASFISAGTAGQM